MKRTSFSLDKSLYEKDDYSKESLEKMEKDYEKLFGEKPQGLSLLKDKR